MNLVKRYLKKKYKVNLRKSILPLLGNYGTSSAELVAMIVVGFEEKISKNTSSPSASRKEGHSVYLKWGFRCGGQCLVNGS
ncbi:hypothetical protein NPIL_310991 [Nephila pilipes]|uniref:Uncharacterized protein n=1 Tax=Nephila pilipes TaxID=299642 RepID=A0A8X6NF91_NEPPI|nr:hypothetical protein NPIL_310991 [Nephila pilipes]